MAEPITFAGGTLDRAANRRTVGFEADYAGGSAQADELELEDARWFSRAELADADAAEGSGCCCRRGWRSPAGSWMPG